MDLKGRCATARVFTDDVESACLDQLRTLIDSPLVAGETVRVMPDCHAGKGCVVGYTQTFTNRICANLVGVDIACGMAYAKVPAIDPHRLDRVIRDHVPAGFDVHRPGTQPAKLVRRAEELINQLRTPLTAKQATRAVASVGTLGGGNHFIELDVSAETGDHYLVVHSGSRSLGLRVAEHWQAIGEAYLKTLRTLSPTEIAELKAMGREKEIQQRIAERKATWRAMPSELAFVEGDALDGYLADVAVATAYADLNRRTMLEVILGKLGLWGRHVDIRTTLHNYVDLDHRVIRKGAIAAYAGDEVLIPLNMRDGALLCVGRGNVEWNCSAPHGAGRRMSRGEARRQLTMDAYRAAMVNVHSTSVTETTLDEAPMAYKLADEIERLINDTVVVREHLRPVYNFKI